MKSRYYVVGGTVAATMVVGVFWLASVRRVEVSQEQPGKHVVVHAPSSSKVNVIPSASKSKPRGLLSVKIVGGQQPRPVAPDDISAFNTAVDAGDTVEAAAKKCFPEGVDTDGILAALKVMSLSRDAKTRCGVYKAVARLFTDADDLASAVATAQTLLATMSSSDDDGQNGQNSPEGQEIDLGDGKSEAEDDAVVVTSEKATESSSDSAVVDDSEADAAGQAEGEVEIPVTAEVEPMCDGVQGDAIDKLLKDGVSDADASVRQEALSAASQMEDHFRYGAYEEVLKGSDSALKKDVLDLCSTFGREEDVAIQKQALNDADADVAATAQKNLDSEAAKSFMEADAAAKAAEQIEATE